MKKYMNPEIKIFHISSEDILTLSSESSGAPLLFEYEMFDWQ